MRAVQSTTRDLVRGPHRRTMRATAWNLAGGYKAIPAVDGEVSFRRSQAVGERSGRIRLPVTDPDGSSWLPQDENSFLGVFGQYVTVEAHYAFPDGSEDVIDLGEFPIIGVSVERPGGFIQLTLGDWAVRAEKNVFDRTRRLGKGTLGSVVKTWLDKALPGTVTVTGSGANNTVSENVKVSAGASVWGELAGLAESVDASITMLDRRRVELVDDPYKPPSSGARETLDIGPDGVVQTIDTEMDLLSMLNRVTVIHENAKTKKTYRSTLSLTTGPFAVAVAGVHDLVESESSDTASQSTADKRAKYLYARRVGVGRSLTVQIVPMAWLEPGDVVRVTGLSGRSEVARVESVTVPFLPDGVCEVRTRTYMNETGAVPMTATDEMFGAAL